jgi:tetratricopeptide (TPR) repeat protein
MYRSLAWLAAALLVTTSAAAHPPASEDIERVTRQLAVHPDAALLLERAELHRVCGEWAAAAADAQEALVLAPSLFAARLSLARTALGAGDAAGAVEEVRRYLDASPDAKGHRVHAAALAALGRRDEAVSAWLQAIDAADPPDPGDYLEAARLLAGSGPADAAKPEAALAVLDRGMEALGPLLALESAAVETLRGAGRHDEALARVDGIIARLERAETWIAERGRILLEAGRRPEAQAAFTEALAAVERLPVHYRGTPAVRRLEAELEERLRS